MKLNFEQMTQEFIRDIKKYLEKSSFQPVLLKVVYDMLDNNRQDIKIAMRNYFALAGLEEGMIIPPPPREEKL